MRRTRWAIAWGLGMVGVVAAAPLPRVQSEPPQAITGSLHTYTVQPSDTLTSVGARAGVDVRGLARLNGLAANAKLDVGRSLVVDSRHVVPRVVDTGIVINIPQRMLFVFRDGRLDAAYPVGLGRRTWRTFIGPFFIERLERDPTWDVPPSIQEEARRSGQSVVQRVPPGPMNPLGKYWIGLDRPGFGIHETNAPSSILIEAHPDVYGRTGDLHRHARELAERRGLTSLIDWVRADAAIDQRDGLVTDVGHIGSPSARGDATRDAARRVSGLADTVRASTDRANRSTTGCHREARR